MYPRVFTHVDFEFILLCKGKNGLSVPNVNISVNFELLYTVLEDNSTGRVISEKACWFNNLRRFTMATPKFHANFEFKRSFQKCINKFVKILL